jgi:diguanylate cyclase (GGDEF)-like protein
MSTGQETRVTKFSRISEKAVSSDACLVVIYSQDKGQLGRKYLLTEEEVTIGRENGNTIVLDSDNVSRRHAKIFEQEGRPVVTDLGSTNGTYCNDAEITEQQLRNGDYIKIGSTIFKYLSGGNVESLYHEEIYRLTIIDGLTQIPNKRFFMDFLEREMARCHRYNRSLSLIMFDIDHFKKVNDDCGHLAGDYVLRELAGLVSQKIRKEECFARYGGEEFAVVLPEAPRDNVLYLAEKLRTLVAEHPFTFEDQKMPVTISLGVADMSPDIQVPLQFIKKADTHLYEAKRSGRNKVVS